MTFELGRQLVENKIEEIIKDYGEVKIKKEPGAGDH